MQDTVRAPATFSEHRGQWEQYVELVRCRMLAAEADYQGRGFDLPSEATIEEIEQELLDVFGWGFLLWRRMQAAKRALAEKLQSGPGER